MFESSLEEGVAPLPRRVSESVHVSRFRLVIFLHAAHQGAQFFTTRVFCAKQML
jgi:hypothetical protein